MKKKIQDALELAYKDKLGLTDKKVYARVAALGETYVAKEEDIPAFVEKAEDIIKGFQGVDDQGRTLATANAKITELEAKIAELEKGDTKDKDDKEGKEGQDDKQTPDIAKIVADAVAAAVKPVQDAFETFKSQTSAKEAKVTAKTKFYENKWTEKFKDEADDAWERAFELNEAKGGNMTADELTTKATEYFNKAVQRKGTDATKPFEAEHQKNGEFDFSSQAKYLESEGLIPKAETN